MAGRFFVFVGESCGGVRAPRPADCDKVGCRAACPQAAGEVCGNVKPYGSPLYGAAPPTPRGGERRRKARGRDESLPYGLPVSGSWPEGSGGVKTPPYDAKDKRAVMARLRAGRARPLRNMVMWDVGRPAPRPPGRLAAMRSLTDRRCRGRRPRRPAEVRGGGRCAGGMNPSPTGYLLAGVGREAAEGSRPLPTM